MRSAVRHRHVEEEEESAFVSMTDMTVSFLFIVMVLLAFFASQINRDDVVPQATYERVLAERDAARVSFEQEKAAHEGTRSELADARSEIVILEARIRDLEAQLADLDALLRAARLTTQELQSELTIAREELEAERAAHAETRRELDAAQARILELEQRIEELERPDPLEEYLSRAGLARLRILQQLQEWLKLDFPDLQVVISAEGDALRFQGEGLFQRGSSILRPDQQRIVETIAKRLDTVLPCYTLGPSSAWRKDCNPGLAVIEAVQIEGHTDSDGSDLDNLALSTARANATFASMSGFVPALTGHLNTRDQPVLSVAGYGEMRPVVANDTPENKSTNRRIDLRIIMHTPASTEELDRIREILGAPLDDRQ